MKQEILNTSLGKATFNAYDNCLTTRTSDGTGFYNVWHQPTIPDPSLIDIEKAFKHLESKPQKQKEKKMAKSKRGLYQVILVDPKEGKIIMNEFVICTKPEDVLLEVDAGKKIKESGLSVSDVDKIINFLGEIRKTKKNKDGIVELVEDRED
jgi:hypothetical protein